MNSLDSPGSVLRFFLPTSGSGVTNFSTLIPCVNICLGKVSTSTPLPSHRGQWK